MSRQSDTPLSPDIFVYDATAAWGELRGGITALNEDGKLKILFDTRTVDGLAGPPDVQLLSDVDVGGNIQPNTLKNRPRGPSNEIEALRCISTAALGMVLTSKGGRLKLDKLQDALAKKSGIDPTKVDDVLRMMGSMNVLLIELQKDGFRVRLTESLEMMYSRREYLSTFTNELLTRSRRIDLLVGHPGTVGTYREELLRGLLKRILPRRYEATTGFIEGCKRQLDIIVWDVENYAPLFREQNFVVVPLAAVRAVIEVKTRLTHKTLKEGLSILWDTFRNRPTVLPVFKGVFAFESDLSDSGKVADLMKKFYDSTDKRGSRHRHEYHWAGIHGVCVPSKHLVRERYRPGGGDAYPQPMLVGVTNQVGGDAYSAIFLGVLLSHLDIATTAKLQNFATFRPVLSALEEKDFGAIYDDWKPSRPLPGHRAVLDLAAAKAYVDQVHAFRAGHLEGDLVGKNLTRPSHSDPDDDAASPDGDGSRSTDG